MQRQRGETCQNSSRIIHALIHRHLGMQVQQNITLRSKTIPISLSLSLFVSHTHTQTLVLRFRRQNLGFLHRCPLICWRETWGRGLGSETDTYLLLLPSGAELWVRVCMWVRWMGEWVSEWVRVRVSEGGREVWKKCVDEWVSEWGSDACSKEGIKKNTQKGQTKGGEKREWK